MRIRKKHAPDKILIRKGDSLRVPSQVPEYSAILTLNLSLEMAALGTTAFRCCENSSILNPN